MMIDKRSRWKWTRTSEEVVNVTKEERKLVHLHSEECQQVSRHKERLRAEVKDNFENPWVKIMKLQRTVWACKHQVL